MPFDFAPAKLTAADRRALALSAFHLAIASPDHADWRGIAADLAACLPAAKAPAPVAADLGEWCEYPAAAHKGKGGTFEANRQAEIMFADMTVIRVSLGHKKGKPMPDWARAVRCAVSFYRARIGAKMRRGFGLTVPASEEYASMIEVPEIALAVDLTREAEADLARANAATAALRAAAEPKAGSWVWVTADTFARWRNPFLDLIQGGLPEAADCALDDHHQRLAA